MLEIIALYLLCGKVGEIIRRKGRKALGYQVLTAVLWFGGEVAGLVVGAIVDVMLHGEQGGQIGLFVYLFALGGAAVGAITAFVIASLVPPAR